MPQIDIDFEVFKQLTNLRQSEAVTFNDVIRELLRLPRIRRPDVSTVRGSKPWVVSNTSFPAGCEFMADYKGKEYFGVVKNGKLELRDGGKFATPSAAAMFITGGNTNGWRFWKCRIPGESQFVPIERLRGNLN